MNLKNWIVASVFIIMAFCIVVLRVHNSRTVEKSNPEKEKVSKYLDARKAFITQDSIMQQEYINTLNKDSFQVSCKVEQKNPARSFVEIKGKKFLRLDVAYRDTVLFMKQNATQDGYNKWLNAKLSAK